MCSAERGTCVGGPLLRFFECLFKMWFVAVVSSYCVLLAHLILGLRRWVALVCVNQHLSVMVVLYHQYLVMPLATWWWNAETLYEETPTAPSLQVLCNCFICRAQS